MPLRMVEEFINTRQRDRDNIGTVRQLGDWFREHNLVGVGTFVTEAERDLAVSVREGLRALIAANNIDTIESPWPDGLDPTARATLIALTVKLPLALDVSVVPPQLVPHRGTPVDTALATLLCAVATAVAAGTWNRLKACREPSCRWAYYDNSRNRHRTWCSMEICGNRAKARAHHQRRTHSE